MGQGFPTGFPLRWWEGGTETLIEGCPLPTTPSPSQCLLVPHQTGLASALGRDRAFVVAAVPQPDGFVAVGDTVLCGGEGGKERVFFFGGGGCWGSPQSPSPPPHTFALQILPGPLLVGGWGGRGVLGCCLGAAEPGGILGGGGGRCVTSWPDPQHHCYRLPPLPCRTGHPRDSDITGR